MVNRAEQDVRLIPFANDEALARAAAQAWLTEIETANRGRQLHLVALSGGRIAQKFFSFAAEEAKARGTAFTTVHFFWADERCVPPEDSESNYRLARQFLFGPLNISEPQIHRVRGELSPETAAQEAERELRRIAPLDKVGQPVIDLIFLGLGEDGHVASLFPGEPEALMDDRRVYRAIAHSPKPPPHRVTLSYQAIATARQVWVLASGNGKEAALGQSLMPTPCTPLGLVLKERTITKIFTDIPLKSV
jgi:6-phosphogluconolactonase